MFQTLYLFFLSFFSPTLVFAQETLDPCADSANSQLAMCAVSAKGIAPAIGGMIQFIFIIATILALGFLVFGGIKWITSGGDKGGVEAARNTIIAAIIGLIVVFLAYVILNLVLIFLTGEGIGGIKIPSLSGASSSEGTDNPPSQFCGGGGQRPCKNNLPVNAFGECSTDLTAQNVGQTDPDWQCTSPSGDGNR